MSRLLILVFIFHFLFISIYKLNAQIQHYYKGEFINELEEVGFANYSYYISDSLANTPVFNGRFSFSTSYEDSAACNQHIEKKYKGLYKHGSKEGAWQYDFSRFDLVLKKIQGLNVTASLYGTQSKINANYKAGEANGKWKFVERRIEDGKVKDILKESTANYLEGNLTGDFTFSDYTNEKFPIEVKGKFNEYGNFDKTWVLSFYKNGDKIEEKRVYKNGFLLELHKKNLDKDSIIYALKYERVIEKLELLENFPDSNFNFSVGPESFGVLFSDGYPSFSDLERGQQLGNSYIVSAIKTFCGPQSEIFAISGVQKIKSGSTKRFRYEYSMDEQKALSSLTENSNTLFSITEKVLANKSFAINHQKNDSLALIYNYFLLIQNKEDSLNQLLELFSSDIFQYKSRENYFGKGLPLFDKSDTVNYDFDGSPKIVIFDYKHSIDNGKDIIVKLADNVEIMSNQSQIFFSQLQPYFKTFEKDKEMQLLEEKMLAKSIALKELYFSDNGNPPTALHQNIYDRIAISKRNSLMQDYSNTENYQEKEQKSMRILYLDSVLTGIYPKLQEINDLPQKLDEQFTNFAYNPYNGKYDIKTRVKKRLYTKVQEELLPYLIDKINTEKDIDALLENVNDILNLHENLIILSKKPDSETNRLERKVKKEKDMDKLLRFLLSWI